MASTLQPGLTLHGEPFLLRNPQIGTSRSGAPYLRCLLGNASGQVSGRCWSFDAARLGELNGADVVEVDGQVVEWQGSPQVNIESIDVVEVNDEVLQTLLPVTKHDRNAMFHRVRERLLRLEDLAMRGLAEAFLDDEPLMQKFREAPAGIAKHHAWIGGLLEHTEQVMRLTDAVLETYRETDISLDGELLVMAAFLHDLGKTSELSWRKGFSYTVDGNMVGHLVRGAMMLEEKAAEAELAGAPPLTPERLIHLQHLILSHHERPEHGAAKRPATPEAEVLCILDRLDATLHLVD